MGQYSIYLDAAKEVAREAGEILRRDYFKTGEVFFKGEVNLVTATDTESQDLIFDRLSKSFPGHDFLAEEGLKELSGAEFRWVFDPLDGTTNFAHRFPVFCVSLGLERGKELVGGVVYNPMSEEMFWAERDEGAFFNGRPIRVSKIDDLNKGLVATGFPYDIRETKANMRHHDAFILRTQAVRRCGSAAIDLCYVACGRFDGFWEMKLSPWDTAAGAVIVAEAGGRVTDFKGGPVDIYHPEVVASNGLIHQAMLDVLDSKSW
jgi:myo-inositol-1(or 4)-monophosphatase